MTDHKLQVKEMVVSAKLNPNATPVKVPRLPPRMIMDLRTDCNLKCPMCIVHGEPDNPQLKGFLRRELGLENARKILDEVAIATPLVMPSLWSEPLLVKDFRDHVRAVKSRGLTLAMNTNGLLLREELAQFFVEVKLDAISFSIDAMTPQTLKKVRGIDKLKKLHDAVALMLRVRGDSELPRVGVSFTVQDSNAHEREAFIIHWSSIVDFVRIGELFKDGRFPNVEVSGPRQPCPALYSTMAIHANGNVSYCCLDGFGETNVGNVLQEGVEKVWNGEKLNKVRRHHEAGEWDQVPFCKSCERWASYGFEEELRDGLLIRRSPEYTYYNRVDRLENWGQGLLGTHKDPVESLRDLTP